MTEIPRWLKLQEEIDWRLFVLGEIQKTLKARMPKNGLEALIDKSCGHDPAAESRGQAIEILTELRELWLEWEQETGESSPAAEVDGMLAELSK